jgi:hypothetical protein
MALVLRTGKGTPDLFPSPSYTPIFLTILSLLIDKIELITLNVITDNWLDFGNLPKLLRVRYLFLIPVPRVRVTPGAPLISSPWNRVGSLQNSLSSSHLVPLHHVFSSFLRCPLILRITFLIRSSRYKKNDDPTY